MAKFYGVKKGKVPGVYSSWSECQDNVKGFPGAEYKSFSSEDEAKKYVSLDKQSEDKISTVSDSSIKPMSDEEFEALQNKAHEYLDFLHEHKLILPKVYEQANRQIDMSIMMQKTRMATMAARGWKPEPNHADIFVDGSYNPDTNEYGYGVYIADGERQRILYGRGVCEANGRNVEGEVAGAKAALESISLMHQYNSVTVYHDYQGIGSWADKKWNANKPYTNAYARFVDRCRSRGVDIEFKHVDGHTGVEGNEYVDKLAKIACGMKLTPAEEKFIGKLSNVQGYPKSRELPELDEPNHYTLIGDYMPNY